MKHFTSSFFFLFVFAAVYANAQDWQRHIETVKQQNGLIRYYLFDDSVAETKTVKNLAVKPDGEKTDLKYNTNKPFEVTSADFYGATPAVKAVRLDAGYFEAPKFAVNKSFTVEMRIRKLGQGTEFGNSGTRNGTLFGFGNGWDNGFRLTTDDARRNLTFSIGRPTNEKSRNLDGSSPLPNHIWQHITAVWDGEYMLLYVDGLLYGTLDYSGDFTDGSWGFRIGFNNAGVGSVKMDVAEVAVYQTALPPETIIQHAAMQSKLPQQTAQLYSGVVESVMKKDYPVALYAVQELLKGDINAEYKFLFQKLQIELAAMSGNQTQALRLAAELLEEPSLRQEQRAALIHRFSSNDNTPLAAASSKVYRLILDSGMIKNTFAVEKCYAEALFTEGKTGDAKKHWDNLKSKEAEIIDATLTEKNLSSDLTDLYKNYQKQRKQLFQSAWEKPKLVSVSPVLRSWDSPYAMTIPFYVSPQGKAENSGSENSPFGSLTQARDAIRKLKAKGGLPKGGIIVWHSSRFC
ncbi:MAG: LamG domain-containing protein [Planctomycetaceae bacterium]|nr:LamG domain-containing protein [Planctomycetaceae bacterium]